MVVGFGLASVPPGPLGAVNWNGVYALDGTAMLRRPICLRFVR